MGAAPGSGSWVEGGAGGRSGEEEPDPDNQGFACHVAVPAS